MGTSLRAKARVQINLAVTQVIDIKQVASFPSIVFPIMWFEEVCKQKKTSTSTLVILILILISRE